MVAETVAIRSAAKINLTLEVGPRRDDGYHDICSVVQTVGLWDRIQFERSDDLSISIECNREDLAIDENLCVRAARLLRDEFALREGCHISLTKSIPMGAGLGGGSGNAAATLIALCRLWRVPCEYDRLIDVSRSLGADVPLFLGGGSVMMRGIGEQLTPLGTGPGWFALVVKPPVSISTARVYQRMDEVERGDRPDHEGMIAALRSSNLSACATLLSNEMERVVLVDHAIVEECKRQLSRVCARGASMSGSGSSVFGLFESRTEAEKAATRIDNCGDVFVAPFVATGYEYE